MQGAVLMVALGIAGALGAVARFAVAEEVARRWKRHFPLATFVINVSGAFALGLLMTAGGRGSAGSSLSSLRLLLGTGFLGGYTTFSTLSVETHSLARRGHAAHAWLNAAGTLAAGVMAAALGMLLGAAL